MTEKPLAPVPNADLSELLADPREALDIEIKAWLDLSTNDHKSVLAKEVIALANHGGGYVIVGFDEQSDGGFKAGVQRPANLDQWSQDAVQSIIARYCDPALQCRVVHQRAGTEGPFPIIIVPGGHKGPILPKAGSPDGKTLVPNRVYIRRAGPSSEEPKTSAEWSQFIDRLVQNRQAELVEIVRSVLSGIPSELRKAATRVDALREFEKHSIRRWEARVANLPSDAPPRFVHGYYEMGFAIDGEFRKPSLADLQKTIADAVRNHSGWPPFLTLNRQPFRPKPIENAVEFWRGPDSDGSFDAPAHHDFWRVSADGLLFTRRGYQEDGGLFEMEQGRFFDITTATWRLGEAVLEASYIAKAMEAVDANIICHCHWVGLESRTLISKGNPNRIMSGAERTSGQPTYDIERTISLEALPLGLPELVHGMLSPLYELFDFFVLPKRLVEEELATLQRNRFYD